MESGTYLARLKNLCVTRERSVEHVRLFKKTLERHLTLHDQYFLSYFASSDDELSSITAFLEGDEIVFTLTNTKNGHSKLAAHRYIVINAEQFH